MKHLLKLTAICFLLAVTLSALGCTPAEEPPAPPPYPISEYADALTEACFETSNSGWSSQAEPISFRWRLTTKEGKERGAQLYLVEVEDHCTVYTCAYVHKDVIPLMDSLYIPYAYTNFDRYWVGDHTRMLTYVDSVLHEVIDPEVYPLTWYEISLDETPPAFIGDLQLILVAIDRTITFTGLIEEERYVGTMFYEDQSFYTTSWEEPLYSQEEVLDLKARMTAEVDFLWIQPIEWHLTENPLWLPHLYNRCDAYYNYLCLENINGTLYWLLPESRLMEDMDLLEDLDYIDGWNEYYGDYRLYKVDDIVALHRE